MDSIKFEADFTAVAKPLRDVNNRHIAGIFLSLPCIRPAVVFGHVSTPGAFVVETWYQ